MGFIDELGATRHALTRDELRDLYVRLDNFIADLTRDEAEQSKNEFTAIKTAIHQRMRETKK